MWGAELRSESQLTLGKLLDKLQKADPAALVQYKDGQAPGKPHSYRGYYEDLAFQDQERITVAEFIQVLGRCHGKVFHGYKGGDFTMDRQTPLWRAYQGACGKSILDVEISNPVILQTE